MKRQTIQTGTNWEKEVAYSRGIRIGNLIEIAGTVANASGGPVHVGNAHLQTIFILEKIQESIEKLGGQLKDVVRTRMYVTDISQWEKVGRAHGQFFKGINPVTTMVEVSGLIDAEYLVEIEATAIIDA